MTKTFTWPELFNGLLDGQDLSISESSWAMETIIRGGATDAQLAAFLVALRAKGETVDEVLGFRDAVLANALELNVSSRALDIVGTGGDQHNSVNVSTTAAIVAAAAGVPVIKHGNKAASSSSGSSDVLTELGINLELEAADVARVFNETGITFAFAAAFHPGFRHAAAARREIGIATIFNILGPLCNPARPQASAVGVANIARVPLVVGVFQSRDATALVFRGDDGLDELTTTGHSHLWEVSRGRVTEHDFDPRDLGISLASLDDLRGGDPQHNAAILRETLAGAPGPVRDIVALNTAAGLVSFELSENPGEIERPIVERFTEQYQRALSVIDSGDATRKLDQWVAATRS
jgi:anthranilate phosphoribosyltransferase